MGCMGRPMRARARLAFISVVVLARSLSFAGGLKRDASVRHSGGVRPDEAAGTDRAADRSGGVRLADVAWTDAAAGLDDLFPDEIEGMLNSFEPSNVSAARLRAPKPMVFVHVHKSLGTWFCWAGRIAGAHTPMYGGDCSDGADNPLSEKDWEYYDSDNDCRRRLDMVQVNGYTMHEIERFVDFLGEPRGDWCVSDFTYAIIMRDPIKRIQSQMKANQVKFDTMEQWFAVSVTLPRPAGLGLFYSHVPFDNFYVRTLCGRDCYVLPAGTLTRTHLQKAKQQLAKLDAVLVAENLLTDLVQIEALTSWKLQQFASNQIHNTPCIDPKRFQECMSFSMTYEQIQIVRKHNELDIELYEFSKEVARNKTRALR